MPVIFAFHGWKQTNEDAMVDGKWGSDYFEKDIAFVIPLGEYSPCQSEDFGRVWLGPLLIPLSPNQIRQCRRVIPLPKYLMVREIPLPTLVPT